MSIYEQLIDAGLTPGQANDIVWMLKDEEGYDNGGYT